MTTSIHLNPALLVDSEFAHIPYSESTLHLNHQLSMKRDGTPISRMASGKFRRLFDRHVTAFRRR